MLFMMNQIQMKIVMDSVEKIIENQTKQIRAQEDLMVSVRAIAIRVKELEMMVYQNDVF